jgi:hypothetical protein
LEFSSEEWRASTTPSRRLSYRGIGIPLYSSGTSEEILGRGLKDFANRDEVVIATKVHLELPREPGPASSRCRITSISPLLANIYLHWFDRVFQSKSGPAHRAKAMLIRYADDFVVMARHMSARIRDFIEQKLETWLG